MFNYRLHGPFRDAYIHFSRERERERENDSYDDNGVSEREKRREARRKEQEIVHTNEDRNQENTEKKR